MLNERLQGCLHVKAKVNMSKLETAGDEEVVHQLEHQQLHHKRHRRQCGTEASG